MNNEQLAFKQKLGSGQDISEVEEGNDCACLRSVIEALMIRELGIGLRT
jgi:hypothetical protein